MFPESTMISNAASPFAMRTTKRKWECSTVLTPPLTGLPMRSAAFFQGITPDKRFKHAGSLLSPFSREIKMEGATMEDEQLQSDIDCWIGMMEEKDETERVVEERVLEENYVINLVSDHIQEERLEQEVLGWIVTLDEEETRRLKAVEFEKGQVEIAEREGRFKVAAKLHCKRLAQGLDAGSDGPMDIKCHHCANFPCYTDQCANFMTSYGRKLDAIKDITQEEKRVLMFSQLVEKEKAFRMCNGRRVIPRCLAYEVFDMYPGNRGNYLLFKNQLP